MSFHFFAYINRMRYINRWGLMRNTRPENDTEHSQQTAMIAHALALIANRRYGKAYDPGFVMALALYHDASEVITGDMPTPVKHNNPAIRQEFGRLEEIANEKLLSMLPKDLKEDYRPLIRHDETTAEWKLVKAADKISAYIKCVEEKTAGNLEFEKAAASIRASIDRIALPEVRDFMNEFVPSFGLTLDEISERAELR